LSSLGRLWRGPRSVLPAPPAPRRPLDARRTDLAIETVREQPSGGVPGVQVEEEHADGTEITRVHVTSAAGEAVVGKPVGTYITIDAPDLRRRDTAVAERVARLLAAELGALLRLSEDSQVFVVGLGNWNATPDALGPKVVSQLLITRHLGEQVPANFAGQMRSVAALAPGVLGLTGIETGEIIRGIVERISPSVVIAVDALASRSIARILRTIQLADTGIHPGSGVGNHRAGIDQASLGIPVIAIGVPTVVHAATIAADTIELLAAHLRTEPAYRGLAALAADDKRQMIAEVLAPAVGDLMVTPKEIDIAIDDMAKIIAAGINAALHPSIAAEALLLG